MSFLNGLKKVFTNWNAPPVEPEPISEIERYRARRSLLEEVYSVQKALKDVTWAKARGQNPNPTRPSLPELTTRLCELVALYKKTLITKAIARNPYSGEIFERTLDTSGLDGLWWNFLSADRFSEKVPEGFVAFTGSLKPAEPLESFPFICRPGPEVPFVLPSLLELNGVCVVLSQIAIGPHQGITHTYFTEKPIHRFRQPNDWGANYCQFTRPDGELHFTEGNTDEKPGHSSYELKPWIDKGKVWWITPGDDTLTLQTGSQGCPFLDASGRQAHLFISESKVWTWESKEK